MSLKGLGKKTQADGEGADDFIKSAKVADKASTQTKAVKFERKTFSLNAEVDAQIDQLSYLPRDFKVSRSDVVKAAVGLLASLSEAEIIEVLRNSSK